MAVVIDVEHLHVGENIGPFEDPWLQTFKRTVDHVFNFLYSFIGCKPIIINNSNRIDSDPERVVLFKFLTSANRRQLELLAFEICVFIDCVKNDFYDKSISNPMIYFIDFFLHYNNQNYFYVLFKMNKTYYMYNSQFRTFLRLNNSFY